MLYIGCDCHWEYSVLHVLDGAGQKVEQRTVRGGLPGLCSWLKGLTEPFKIVFEASGYAGCVYDRLTEIADEVQVAHPGHLAKLKRKNDRIDAERLGRLLHQDCVPQVHMPKEPVRQWRRQIEERNSLVEIRTATKNGIQSLLKREGIRRPEEIGQSLWTRAGLGWLAKVELSRTARDELNRKLALLDLLEEQLGALSADLDRQVDQSAACQLVMTIPGVGPRTAEAVAAYIDEPGRFDRIKCISSYFGLVPTQDQSQGKNNLGHITRDGPPTVRKMLVESAWRALRKSPSLSARFQRITRGSPQRRKVAIVAIANCLARSMLSMLRTGETWREVDANVAAAA